MGWRYLLFTLGGITLLLWSLRFFAFKLLESPRYLAGLDKDAEAVAIIHQLAEYNSATYDITVEKLAMSNQGTNTAAGNTSGRHKILSASSRLSLQHIKALFATPKMARSTGLLIALWGRSISSH